MTASAPKFRWLVPTLLPLAVVGALVLWAWPDVTPESSDDLAVAFGARPPLEALSGWWRWAVSSLLTYRPANELFPALRWGGVLGGGVLALLVYSFLRSVLPALFRYRLNAIPRGRIAVETVLACGTLLFMCNATVWGACQCLGPDLLELIVAVAALRLTIDFLQRGTLPCVYVSTLLFGLMTGEGAIGLAAFCFLWAAVFHKSLSNRDNLLNPLTDPIVRNRLLTRMTALYALVSTGMMVVNYHAYYALGGLQVSDFLPADVAVVSLGGYALQLRAVTGWVGWLFVLVFTVGPFVIVLSSLPKVLVEDRLQSRTSAVTIFLMGLLAWSQVAGVRALWARSWIPAGAVTDVFSVAMLCLIGAVTFVWALAVLTFNTYFRNIRRIVGYQFGEDAETVAADRAVVDLTRFNRGLKLLVWLLVLLVLAGTVPLCGQGTARRMQQIVLDYCREVVHECGDASRILTDGSLDSAIELAARLEGRQLAAVSMLSGSRAYDVALRQRNAETEDERNALECGPFAALDHWYRVATNVLPQVAFQFGFDRRQLLALRSSLWISGLVGRIGAAIEEKPDVGIGLARSLGERVLEVCADENPDGIGNDRLREQFRFVQWRVAQMCRMRADVVDSQTWGDSERADEDLCRRLDEANTSLQTLKRRLSHKLEKGLAVLSPREGLVLGLQRADFRLAKMFAEAVIRSDPGDVMANFALGMHELTSERPAEAIPHFELVLARKPDEPVVLNNLATACNRLGLHARAIDCALRAHLLLPKDASIRANLTKFRQDAEKSLLIR